MASGHVNRIYRPNTWPHRPSLRREDFSCQPGAVHTGVMSDLSLLSGVKQKSDFWAVRSAFDPGCVKTPTFLVGRRVSWLRGLF